MKHAFPYSLFVLAVGRRRHKAHALATTSIRVPSFKKKKKNPLINLSWTKSKACGLMKLRVPLDVHNIHTQAVWAVCLCTDEVSHTCPLTGLNQFSRTYCATTWKTYGRHTSQGSGPGGPSTFAEPPKMNSGDGNDGKTWTSQDTAPPILIIIELYWIVGARAVGR